MPLTKNVIFRIDKVTADVRLASTSLGDNTKLMNVLGR